MVSDVACNAALAATQDFVLRHATMSRTMSTVLMGLMERFSVTDDYKIKLFQLRTLSSTARSLLTSYRYTHNRFLRANRRNLRSLVEGCGGALDQGVSVLRKLKDMVSNTHEKVDVILGAAFDNVTRETNDDGTFDAAIRDLAAVRDSVARSRGEYLQAYTSLNFMFVLVDGHFGILMVVKAFKALLLYMSARMVQVWASADVARSRTPDVNDVLWTAIRRLLCMMLVVDASIVLLLFCIAFAIRTRTTDKSFLGPEASLWTGLLHDSVIATIVAAALTYLMAYMVRHKTYMRLSQDPRDALESLFLILVRMLCTNAMIPYFLMT